MHYFPTNTNTFSQLLYLFIVAIAATPSPVKKLNLKYGDKLTPPFYQAMFPYFVIPGEVIEGHPSPVLLVITHNKGVSKERIGKPIKK